MRSAMGWMGLNRRLLSIDGELEATDSINNGSYKVAVENVVLGDY
jgi:hypothetical protein